MEPCKTCGHIKEEKPTAVVTVRMTKSLHNDLLAVAHQKCISLNKLCIDALEKELCTDASEH